MQTMLLKRRDIDELKAIYHRRYGDNLPDDEAWELGNRLVRVFTVLARSPAPKDNSAKDSNPVLFD